MPNNFWPLIGGRQLLPLFFAHCVEALPSAPFYMGHHHLPLAVQTVMILGIDVWAQ